jgi:hypothetical protein
MNKAVKAANVLERIMLNSMIESIRYLSGLPTQRFGKLIYTLALVGRGSVEEGVAIKLTSPPS